MNIGIFDSGIGGEAVAASLRDAYPEAGIIVVNDHANVPYGTRPVDEIRALTDNAIQPLLRQNCSVIVIACNTATAAAIEWLREKYPKQLFLGLEPMLKPARLLTKTGTITICATPATLASERYASIKSDHASNTTIIEPDCSEWAYMIEHNQMSDQHITDMVQSSVDNNSDVIVLACTHYHWIRERIENIAGSDITVLDPSDAIARRVAVVLEQT